MMVTLLAKSSSPAMRDMLKDLYASISESKNKKIQDKRRPWCSSTCVLP